MSVPLDRLYNFLHDVVDHDITIYRFWPHGSKKLEDLVSLLPHSWSWSKEMLEEIDKQCDNDNTSEKKFSISNILKEQIELFANWNKEKGTHQIEQARANAEVIEKLAKLYKN